MLLLWRETRKDLQKSFHWLLKAAKQDYFPALYMVGVSYDFGKGVDQDKAKAVEYYRMAANKRSSAALYNLAESSEGKSR